MNVLKLLRYIMGEVEFKASGGFAERFINLCAENDVILKDVKLFEKEITGFVKASDYRKAGNFAKRSGMRVRCVKKSGLYFFLKQNRKRAGLAVSFLVFALFLAISSLFVWNVEVTGAQNVNYEIVKETLAELGVKQGALKRNIDFKTVQTQAMIKLNKQVSWLAVNIKGTKAQVEIRDYVARKKSETYSDPCNIVADKDGLVLSIDAYNGQIAAKEGSAVRQGDLLISGIVENRDASAQFMEARGTVTLLRNYETQREYAKYSLKKHYTAQKTRYLLDLFGIKIPIGFFKKSDKDYEDFISRKSLSYRNVELPFSLVRHTRMYFREEKVPELTQSSADDFLSLCFEQSKNSLVLSQDTEAQTIGEKIVFTQTNRSIDFCGKKQKIQAQE